MRLLDRPSLAHPLLSVGRSYDGACTQWLPALEPGPPPAETGVGQMDGELAGVSTPHVLGPGQSTCHHQGRLCTCASLPVELLTKPCYLLSTAVFHRFFFLFLSRWRDQPCKRLCSRAKLSSEFWQSRVSEVSLSGEGQRLCLLILIMGNVINAGIKC